MTLDPNSLDRLARIEEQLKSIKEEIRAIHQDGQVTQDLLLRVARLEWLVNGILVGGGALLLTLSVALLPVVLDHHLSNQEAIDTRVQ